LNPGELSSFKLIGVTAGASTPNWMIKNVVKEIESVRSRGETFWGRSIKRLFKALLLSNILVAIGAFSLTFSAMILSGRRPDFIHPTIALFYIYAMYVLNRFLDKGAGTYNDPERASFYSRKRITLIVSALASITAALTLSFALGTATFFAVLGLSILGAIYSIPILPVKRRERWRYSKIKDIPGSKTLAESLAWGALICFVPLLEPGSIKWQPIFISFLFVFSMVYVKGGLFDIFQVQGDLIVGVETLPISFGEKKTLRLLKGIIIGAALVLSGAPLLRIVGFFSYLLLLCCLSLFLSLLTYEKQWLYPGIRFETLVEANFFLAGLLGLIWYFLS